MIPIISLPNLFIIQKGRIAPKQLNGIKFLAQFFNIHYIDGKGQQGG